MTRTKPGRPREFNIEQALAAAIGIFWAKGYDGTSLSDLTDAMGITRPSLYAAFGDKRGLYLKAIEQYSSSTECPPLVAFEAEEDIRNAVWGFMTEAVNYATQGSHGQLGCFLGSCVSTNAGEVKGVQPRLRQAIEETDARLAARFDQEKAQGVLPHTFPSLERARLMFDLRQGFALRARAGIGHESMKVDLEQRVAMVLA